MDGDIKGIVHMIMELDELACIICKTIVEDICTKKYIYLYPDMIISDIYTYKELYVETEKG